MSKEVLAENFETIVELYTASFAGFPWFEVLSQSEVERRLNSNSQQQGFTLIDHVEDDHLVGALWYDTPSLEALAAERGQDVAHFAQNIMSQNELVTLVWEREVMVSPEQQGKGIATSLRTRMIEQIEAQFKSALILTRMRDDNVGIIKIAEKVGFSRTGMKRPSSQTPDFMHEFWYRIVKKSTENI